MNQINLEGKEDEKVTEYEGYYNAFIACYWIMMILTVHFLFRFLNARENIEHHVDIGIIHHHGANMIRPIRLGNNFHRRFIENLNEEDLGYGEEFDEEFDSRGV